MLVGSVTNDDLGSEVDNLIEYFSPTTESDFLRRGMINYISDLFRKHGVGCTVAMGGSFPLRVYLPESDLDVVILSDKEEGDKDNVQEIMDIFSCLCEAIRENERNSLPMDFEEFKIQSVEFINARTRVIKCVINRMSLDITTNQRSSLASATFLEEASRLIGNNHLFKRSVLLVKAWCVHESKRYCGVSISGSKGGMLSSYALSVLVLYIFATHSLGSPSQDGSDTTTNDVSDSDERAVSRHFLRVNPLDVLRAFLNVFSSFPWDSNVITLGGPVPIKTGNLDGSKSACRLSPDVQHDLGNHLQEVATKVHESMAAHRTESDVLAAAAGGTPNMFPVRCCNIADPVDSVNNLGVPVSWRNLKVIRTALEGGSQHLESMLSVHFAQMAMPQQGCSMGNGCLSPPSLECAGSSQKTANSQFQQQNYSSSVLVAPHSGIAPGLSLPPRPPQPKGPSTATSTPSLPIAPSISSSSFSAISSPHTIPSSVPCLIADQWNQPHQHQQPAQMSYASVAAPLTTDRSGTTLSASFVRSFFSACFHAYHVDAVPHLSLKTDARRNRHGSIGRNPLDASSATSESGRQRAHSYSTVTTTAFSGSSSNDSSPNGLDKIGHISLQGDLDGMWTSLLTKPNTFAKPDSIQIDTHITPVTPVKRTPGHCSEKKSPRFGDMVLNVDCIDGMAHETSTDGDHSPYGSTSCGSGNVSLGGDLENELALDDDPFSLIYGPTPAGCSRTVNTSHRESGTKTDGVRNADSTEKRNSRKNNKMDKNAHNESTNDSSMVPRNRARANTASTITPSPSVEESSATTKGVQQPPGTKNGMMMGRGKKKKGQKAQKSVAGAPVVYSPAVDCGAATVVTEGNVSSDDEISVMKSRNHEAAVQAASKASSWSQHAFVVVSGIVAVAAIGLVVFLGSSGLPVKGLVGRTQVLHNTSLIGRHAVPVIKAEANSGKSTQTPYETMLNAFNGNVADMEASMQVAEMWLRQGDNVTLGLSQLSQDMFYYYMNNDPSVREKGTIGEKLSVMWLKDGESYHTSKENSSVCFEDIYLPLNNVESSSTPGLYSFVVVKDYPGLDECSTPPSDKIVRTLAKTSVNIGVAPSSKTKGKHLVLNAGSAQLYLHVQVEGAPTPSIQWFKNGIPLPGERKSNLIVNNVDKSHEGTYSCQLTNMAGVYTWLEATVIVR